MSEVKITPDDTPDLTQLDPILDEYRGQKGAVIPVLQKAQKIYGYLPPEVLRRIAAGMRVPLSKIYGVATFYSQFYLTRRGRHIVRQCDGTACHVRGAGKIVDAHGAGTRDPGRADHRRLPSHLRGGLLPGLLRAGTGRHGE